MKFIYLTLSLVLSLSLYAQDTTIIKLLNPSFEDNPAHSVVPRGWLDCGFLNESPPDINPSGEFGIIQQAYEGKTYLGMVTRDNRTWEAIGQQLASPLKEGNHYTISLALSKSQFFLSLSRVYKPYKGINYTNSTILRIWGGHQAGERTQLLAESDPIGHLDWRSYQFSLFPAEDFEYILLEVFYSRSTIASQTIPITLDASTGLLAGHIFIDDISPIYPIEQARSQWPDFKEVSDGKSYHTLDKDSIWLGYSEDYIKHLNFPQSYKAPQNNLSNSTLRNASTISTPSTSSYTPPPTNNEEEPITTTTTIPARQPTDPDLINQMRRLTYSGFQSLTFGQTGINFQALFPIFKESPHLHQIYYTAGYMPEHQIIIAVKGTKQKTIDSRKEKLIKQLKRIGMDTNSINFAPWEETKDSKLDWVRLYGTNAYLMRVQRK